MRRLHLFELDDQPWYPRALGDAGTAYLNTLQERLGLDAVLGGLVAEHLDRTGATRVVDLCAGSGGPSIAISRWLEGHGRALPFVATDRRPERLPQATRIIAHPDPVDATAVPQELSGLRTMHNALHHFPDEAARAVLADAARQKQPMLVVELSERSAAAVVGSAFIPLMVCALMPLVRPLRADWLALTYLFPVLPWAIAWDGLVSHLRCRTVDELQALADSTGVRGYRWQAGRTAVGKGPMGVTWLRGQAEG